MRVLVLGSGVIGVASAYYLAQQVRRKKPASVMPGRFLQDTRPLGLHQVFRLRQSNGCFSIMHRWRLMSMAACGNCSGWHKC